MTSIFEGQPSKACSVLDKQDIRLFETFCGAIGEWTRSANWLHNGGFNITTVGAGDWSAEAVDSWNLNAQEIYSENRPKAELINFAVIEDWQRIIDTQANVLSVSSSCRSFSSAGKQLGWEAEDGMHLALTIAFASLHGFQIVLFENVAPILQDKKHRNQLEKVLGWYGYRIIFEVCISIQD